MRRMTAAAAAPHPAQRSLPTLFSCAAERIQLTAF